jgi:glutaredoxin
MFFARPFLAVTGLAGLLAVAGFSSSDVNAQQIYRILGSDGRITYSDKAPLEATARSGAATAVPMPGAGALNSALPFELRQAASRYPVTLYTGPGCDPCLAGRAMLAGRGVPFTEKTVTTNEDIEALKRLAGAPSLPFLTIGGQQLKGFSEAEWVQFLDAAGYPKTSQLPTSYTPQPATSLVSAQQPEAPVRAAPQAARAAAPAPAPAPGAATADNPAGIRF